MLQFDCLSTLVSNNCFACLLIWSIIPNDLDCVSNGCIECSSDPNVCTKCYEGVYYLTGSTCSSWGGGGGRASLRKKTEFVDKSSIIDILLVYFESGEGGYYWLYILPSNLHSFLLLIRLDWKSL